MTFLKHNWKTIAAFIVAVLGFFLTNHLFPAADTYFLAAVAVINIWLKPIKSLQAAVTDAIDTFEQVYPLIPAKDQVRIKSYLNGALVALRLAPALQSDVQSLTNTTDTGGTTTN